jgi:integrase
MLVKSMRPRRLINGCPGIRALTGAKPPLRPKHVWSIRTKLQIEGRVRDLAMFNLAIDSKLRGCDVVATRAEDVAAGGYTADRATVRQKKTGQPVRFELSEQTRQAIDDYLKAANKRPGEFLFTGRRGANTSMTTRQYARLVSDWIGSVGLDPRLFGTHSLRRTKALSADRKSPGHPALARAYQDRKHGQVSRHRGR